MSHALPRWSPPLNLRIIDVSDTYTYGMTECQLCDEPITDGDWMYSGHGNGAVHNRHRKSDAELLALLDDRVPCAGCKQICAECERPERLHYSNGFDGGDIHRDGYIYRHVPLACLWPAQRPLAEEPAAGDPFWNALFPPESLAAVARGLSVGFEEGTH